ncbi:hypothetical protein GZH53_13215 [Flavihumibacter sp. R14]|nr:hypothetical protein [Flavihumibacter soli]
MKQHHTPDIDYTYFYILALVCGILTAWVISGSVLWTILGAILGLLFAAFFVNALVKDSEV